MHEDRMVAVSPKHSVLLSREYLPLIEKPPQRDFVVRTISTRFAGSLPLMAAELVIASRDTIMLHPLSRTYPLHFRKTYFPGRLHSDPKIEFENQQRASELIGVSPPIGYAERVFRSCLIPGIPFSRLSPFGIEPETANLAIAEQLDLAKAAGLWRLLEEALEQVLLLQEGGLVHSDLELHNLIVCPSPLEIVLIDFERAVKREDLSPEAFRQRCEQDCLPLLREAIFLQCALGRQSGRLADLAWSFMDRTFKDPDRFRRAIRQRAGMQA